jgi:hypothetical protein
VLEDAGVSAKTMDRPGLQGARDHRRAHRDRHGAQRTKSERVGAVPYGHRLAADGRTLLPIAAELARAGMVARSGKRFAAAQVQRMVAA